MGMLGIDGKNVTEMQVESAYTLFKQVSGTHINANSFLANLKRAFALPRFAPVLA